MPSDRRLRPRPDIKNLHLCGFVCNVCLFQMRLSELNVTDSIIGSFKAGTQAVNITCPECGQAHDYSSADLKVFLPGVNPTNRKCKSTAASEGPYD